MKKNIIILILVILLGFILRIWHAESVPPGINRDEASIGYTTYSILKTGRDEYGVFLPLSIKSFGDWKLPLYVYLDLIPVGLLSLSDLSVRLPSLVFGTLNILLAYYLVRKVFEDYPMKEVLALLSAFFLAISPWHIFFSRVAAEANIALFLVSLGLLLFFHGLKEHKFLLLSSISLALSLYTYHADHVFTVLLFLFSLFVLIKSHIGIRGFSLFLLPFGILTAIIFGQTFFKADKTKLSGLTPLSDKYSLYASTTLARLDHPDPYADVTALFHNKIEYLSESFINGYIKGFSPEFLFIKGGDNMQHNIPDFGNLYIWEAPFIILGLYFLYARKIKWRGFLLFWLLISPLAAAITKDAPHTARMSVFLPLPHILTALGMISLFYLSQGGSFLYKMRPLFILLLIINISLFMDRYFIHFPKVREAYWGGGYRQLVMDINNLSSNYNYIVVDRPDYSSYIYFLFYNKVDPATYQKETMRYAPDSEGFQHVKSFGKLNFQKFNWTDELIIPSRLLVTWADATPPSATHSAVIINKLILQNLQFKFGSTFNLKLGDKVTSQLIKVIRLNSGQPQFYLIDVQKQSAEDLKL